MRGAVTRPGRSCLSGRVGRSGSISAPLGRMDARSGNPSGAGVVREFPDRGANAPNPAAKASFRHREAFMISDASAAEPAPSVRCASPAGSRVTSARIRRSSIGLISPMTVRSPCRTWIAIRRRSITSNSIDASGGDVRSARITNRFLPKDVRRSVQRAPPPLSGRWRGRPSELIRGAVGSRRAAFTARGC